MLYLSDVVVGSKSSGKATAVKAILDSLPSKAKIVLQEPSELFKDNKHIEKEDLFWDEMNKTQE